MKPLSKGYGVVGWAIMLVLMAVASSFARADEDILEYLLPIYESQAACFRAAFDCNHTSGLVKNRMERDCPTMDRFADEGSEFYREGKWEKARDRYKTHAIFLELCKDVDNRDSRIAVAYNNVAKTYIKQGNYLTARAWLMIKPNAPQSRATLKKIQTKLNAFPTVREGVYKNYVGRGAWQKLTVTRGFENDYVVDMNFVLMGENDLFESTKMGSAVATMPRGKKKAVYWKNEGFPKNADSVSKDDSSVVCMITVEFGKNMAAVKLLKNNPIYGCGFSPDIVPDGTYYRVADGSFYQDTGR